MTGKTLGYCHSTVRCLFPLAAVVVAGALGLCVIAAPNIMPDLSPATLTVTKLADTNDGSCDADCSLREALAIAVPGDTVAFAPGLKGAITLNSTLNIRRNVTINGPSTEPIIISGNNAVRVFYVSSGVHFTIRNLTVADGRINGTSRSLIVPGVSDGLGGNAEGGGLCNDGGSVTIINSTFFGNRANGGTGGAGGGLVGIAGTGGDGMGGALFTSGTAYVVNSTFSANSARGGAGGEGIGDSRAPKSTNGGNGGGGYGGAIFSTGDLWVSNCTFAENRALGAAGGWGRASSNGRAGSGLGGAIYRPLLLPGKNILAVNKSGAIHLSNTLIAGSTSGGNCEALIHSRGYNLDTDGTCGLTAPGDLSKITLKLGPLKNNSGSTFTHSLLSGSPAIDAGNPAGCTDHTGAAIATDQRGRNRSGRCDIGAFELSP